MNANTAARTSSKPERQELIWLLSKYIYYSDLHGFLGMLAVRMNDLFVFALYLLSYCIKYIIGRHDNETMSQIKRYVLYIIYIFKIPESIDFE